MMTLSHGISAPILFFLVYLGMILGGLPFLQLDRTGIALLGAIALIATNSISVSAAVHAIDASTLILLFSFMVISAQMRLGGFYESLIHRLETLPLSASALLALLIALVALLAAIFSNDVVCLALTAPLIELCRRRQLPPLPYLWALACAANLGSAATLIGNPQNMLIGQTLHLSFAAYSALALPAVLLSLAFLWYLLHAACQPTLDVAVAPSAATPALSWQSLKGLTVVSALMLCMLLGTGSRDRWALIGAGLLLTSRHLHSRRMLALVDWNLLVLFIGLFIVNRALQDSGLSDALLEHLAHFGLDSHSLPGLTALCVLLSASVSNVPAVMLLLPHAGHAGAILALASTFSGNFLLMGSIANLIVAEAASAEGITISARAHARIGIPVSLFSLASMLVLAPLQGLHL